ncbi:MAG: FAD-binding oxidoreductase [Chloroflexi bacterium]|nr:FAD-binding oxidoreductase [Chloroflexota bacterium]
MEKEAEVVIIGAGIAGLTTAYYLAQLGKKDVVVLEKREIGCMASGTNAALVSAVSPAYGTGPESDSMIKMGLFANDEYERFHNQWGYDLEFERCGSLVLTETEELFEKRKSYVDLRHKQGVTSIRLIHRDELFELEPNLAPDLYGAEFRPFAGHIMVMYFMCALGDKLRESGIRIYEYTPAIAIKTEGGRVKSVVTPQGEIKAKYVVNAAGIAAPSIGEMVGIKIPIDPNREQMLVTEEMPRIISHPLLSASYFTDLDRTGGVNETKAFACNPQKKGNILLVGVNDFVGEDRRISLRAFYAVPELASRYIPMLKTQNVHIIRGYANFYVHTPDSMPIMGKVDGLEGFIIVGGLCDIGMTLGAGVGKCIAELIYYGESSIPIQYFSLSRFN